MTRSRRRREARTAPPARRPAVAPRPLLRWYGAVRRQIRRRPVRIALGLALLHIALGLLTFEPQPHTGGDNAAYISLATSLLERGEYVELWDPAEPPHTKYPPVFAGVLALAMAIGLKPFVQLKLVVLAMSAAAVAFSFLWVRSRRRPMLALAVGVLLALAPGVLREGRWLLSDVPFWCFTMIALWAFERLRPGDRLRFGVGAAAVLLAFFTRSAGLPLALAAVAWLAWRRHWAQLGALVLIVGVPAVAWWLRARSFGPAGYVSEFWLLNPYDPAAGTIGAADLISRVVENIGRYIRIHLPILLTGSQSALMTIVSGSIVLLALTGWVRRVRNWQALKLADLFLPLYLGLIFIWPAVWSGERFLLAALALLLLFAGESLIALARRLAGRYDIVAGATAVLLLALLALPALANGAGRSRECVRLYRAGHPYACLPGPHWEDMFELAQWSAVALPEDAVVVNRKPRLFYVLSGRRSVIYPFSSDAGDFFDLVRESGARYVVFDRVSGESERYLAPVLIERSDAFCVMHVLERTSTVLLGILPTWSDPTAPAAAAQRAEGFEPCGDEYWRSTEAREQLLPPG